MTNSHYGLKTDFYVIYCFKFKISGDSWDLTRDPYNKKEITDLKSL